MEAFILWSLMAGAAVVGTYLCWENLRDMWREAREDSRPESDEPPEIEA